MLPLLFPPLLISDWSRGRRQRDESPQDLSRTHTNTHKHLASAHKSLSYTTSANKQVAKVRRPWWETASTQNTHAHTHTCTHTHTHFYWLMCEEISGSSQIWRDTETSSDCRLCVCSNVEDAIMTPRLNHSKSVCTFSHH